MKKLFFITISLVIISCSNESSEDNSIDNSVDYGFKLGFGTNTYEVDGNTANSNWDANDYILKNSAYCNQGGVWLIKLEIKDPTHFDHISGDNMQIEIKIPSIEIGLVDAYIDILFTGSLFQTLSNNSVQNTSWYFSNPTNSQNSQQNKKIALNITDLGTESNLANNHWGETIKGNFNGTLYFFNSYNGHYDIPINITLRFEALRVF